MKEKDRICEREYQDSSREFAENHLQHATAAAEITRDRNQKAQSAEEGGKQSRMSEVDDDASG